MSSRHADCVMARVVERFDLIVALVLGVGLARCELVIPPGQYTSEPQAKDSDGVMTPATMVDASDAGSEPEMTDDASIESNDADRGSDVGLVTTSDAKDRPDQTSVSTGDGAKPTEGGVRSDATTGTVPRDAAAKDAPSGDAPLPDGATLECHLACDGTFCCTGQVCCPSVCDTQRCVLALTCPSKTNVACQ